VEGRSSFDVGIEGAIVKGLCSERGGERKRERESARVTQGGFSQGGRCATEAQWQPFGD
jgi:hypothetical protein